MIEDFKQYCITQHDIVCNQKYDRVLPYSQHLKYVVAQWEIFKSCLKDKTEMDLAYMGCWGHDLIEDARVTYNDILQLVGPEVAEIIYSCTEEKGRNRHERHSDVYYHRLATNKLGVFVKLCDIIANVTYSILTNSSMYNKHKKEHEKTLSYFLNNYPEFNPMFMHLDELFKLR